MQADCKHGGGIRYVCPFSTNRLTETNTYSIGPFYSSNDRIRGFAPHCPNGPIALMASFQMDVSIPNFTIQEMSYRIHYNTDADLGTYILVCISLHKPCHWAILITVLVLLHSTQNPEVFAVEDGMVNAPTAPGLGLIMNEDLIREKSKTALPWANPVWRGEDGYIREW